MDNSNIYIFILASSLHYKLIYPSAFFRCLVNCLIGISILVFQKWSWFPSPTPRLPTCLFHLSLVNTSSQKLPKSGSHQIYIPLLLPSHICKSCYFSLQKYLESVQFSPSLCCYPIPNYHHPSHVTPAEPWRQKEKWVHESGWLLWYAHIIWCYMAHSCSSWKEASLLAYISSCFMPCNMTESGIPSLDRCTGEDSEDWFYLWRGHRAQFLTSPHDWGFPSEASKSMT